MNISRESVSPEALRRSLVSPPAGMAVRIGRQLCEACGAKIHEPAPAHGAARLADANVPVVANNTDPPTVVRLLRPAKAAEAPPEHAEAASAEAVAMAEAARLVERFELDHPWLRARTQEARPVSACAVHCATLPGRPHASVRWPRAETLALSNPHACARACDATRAGGRGLPLSRPGVVCGDGRAASAHNKEARCGRRLPHARPCARRHGHPCRAARAVWCARAPRAGTRARDRARRSGSCAGSRRAVPRDASRAAERAHASAAADGARWLARDRGRSRADDAVAAVAAHGGHAARRRSGAVARGTRHSIPDGSARSVGRQRDGELLRRRWRWRRRSGGCTRTCASS